jgi:hypothetical protein
VTAGHDTRTFSFVVEGVEEQTTALPTARKAFNETYEIEGEHPAEALEQLVRHEIEWGILDSVEGFTITFEPKESTGG